MEIPIPFQLIRDDLRPGEQDVRLPTHLELHGRIPRVLLELALTSLEIENQNLLVQHIVNTHLLSVERFLLRREIRKFGVRLITPPYASSGGRNSTRAPK